MTQHVTGQENTGSTDSLCSHTETLQGAREADASSLKVPMKFDCDILIIEDEPLVAALLRRYLTSFVASPQFEQLNPKLRGEFNVNWLESGWELIHADLSKVKVVVVDMLLPQVTGVDLVRDFRKRFPKMGLLPISGMATEPMKRSLKEILPNNFKLVAKPLRKEEFFDAFVKAWNYQIESNQQPMRDPTPTKEAGEELWTEVRTDPNIKPVVPEFRRGLARKKQAA